MARLFPDSDKCRVIFSSSAEEQFYDACRAALDDDWRVYHSCVLSRIEGDEGLVDNEIDFVLYHPRLGAIVIEVKGGRIQFDPAKSQFYSINRHGETFAIKNPFQQALVWKSRLLRVLQREGVRVPVTRAICLPAVNEGEIPAAANVEPALIIGVNRIKSLASALDEIVRRSQPEKYLEFTDVSQRLDSLLAGATFTTKTHLKDYLRSHETRLKDLETIHETLLTPIANATSLGIEGEAGTGKTLLATLLARHFRDQGKSVLLLSSNTLLTLLLKREAGPRIDIASYGELDTVAESSRRFDVLICDEAQDVQPARWEIIQKLRTGAEDDRLYVFFDRSQGVFGSGATERQFEPEKVLPVPPPYFPLVHNYRTTREITTFARPFRTGKAVLQSYSGRLGYVPEVITYKDAEDARRQLGSLLRRTIRDEGLDTADITILSARNPEADESVLRGTPEVARVPLHVLRPDRSKTWNDAFAPRGKVAVSTIAGFKGLETSVGILLNVSEYDLPVENPIMASLLYVACTRAKHMLYVLVRHDDPKRHALENALKAIRSNGSMVLGGSVADFEFTGRVAHYNPERFGLLAVDDPAFQKNNIMFFPHDVQRAGLANLKVGMRLKFRPQTDGHVTIASDLKSVFIAPTG